MIDAKGKISVGNAGINMINLPPEHVLYRYNYLIYYLSKDF